MARFLKARLSWILLAGVAVVPMTNGCGSGAPAEPVAAFEAFEASDKSFTGQGPAGWEKGAGDAGGTIGRVVFAKGDAKIRVSSSAASSFMADAMKSGPTPAVEVLHTKGLEKLADYFSNPEPGPMKEMKSAIGDARYCEFTADGGKTRGYRSTAVGPQRVIYVTASCPESDWETLKPAFSKVIDSIQNGSGP